MKNHWQIKGMVALLDSGIQLTVACKLGNPSEFLIRLLTEINIQLRGS
jgi:hypothetical protein